MPSWHIVSQLQSRAGPSCLPVLMSSLQGCQSGHIHDCQELAGNAQSAFQSRGQALLTGRGRCVWLDEALSGIKEEGMKDDPGMGQRFGATLENWQG